MIPASGQRWSALAVVLAGLFAIPVACTPQAPRQTTQIIRQIDHILIASREAKVLFSLLKDTFQLPVAWPMLDYGGFASGGVSSGNVHLEILKASQSDSTATRGRFTGFALEPEPLRTSLPELKARGIPLGKPAPFRSKQPDGSTRTLWTTVALPEVSTGNAQVFLCEYGHDVPARRRHLLEQLQSRGGGPLSVLSIREVVYGVRDLKSAHERWQKLLNPLQASPQGVWQLGDGPAIRVIQTESDGVQGLVIAVKSLSQARRFLQEKGLLGLDEPASLTVAGPPLQGLNVTLVEQQGLEHVVDAQVK